jgi:hypothetical protein
MKTITAKKLEEKFNNNEEISDYMDFTNVKKLSSFINEEIEDRGEDRGNSGEFRGHDT